VVRTGACGKARWNVAAASAAEGVGSVTAGTSATATSGAWSAAAAECVATSCLQVHSFSQGLGAGFPGSSRGQCEQQSRFGSDAWAVVRAPQHPVPTRQQSGLPSAMDALAVRTMPNTRTIP